MLRNILLWEGAGHHFVTNFLPSSARDSDKSSMKAKMLELLEAFET
jgi:hypothetical protein